MKNTFVIVERTEMDARIDVAEKQISELEDQIKELFQKEERKNKEKEYMK